MARADVLADHLVFRVQSHRKAIADVRVFEQVDPRTTVLAMDWSPKTLSALLNGAQLIQGEKLRSLTWGQLLSIDGFDAKSALEFALRVESKQAQYGPGPQPRGLTEVEAMLQASAQSRWARRLTLNDPRLPSPARNDRRSVAEAIKEDLDAARADRVTPVKGLLSNLEAIRSVGEAIEAENLECQLSHVVAALMNLSGDRLTGLAARMGIPGPRATLRAAGEIAGLSGMRIQQLQVALMDRVKGKRYMYLPTVDAAEEALVQASPIWVSDALHHIAEKGISQGTIDVAVFVNEWLSALGRSILSVTQYDGADWVICRARGTIAHQLRAAGYIDTETGREIIEAARRLCQSVGVASIAWIAEEVDLGDQEQAQDIVDILKRSGEFSFLGPAWFWSPALPRRRNRLENALRKIVAVSQRVTLSDALESLDRSHILVTTTATSSLTLPSTRALSSHRRSDCSSRSFRLFLEVFSIESPCDEPVPSVE